MDRREALKRAGTLAVVPVLGAFHPLVPVPQGSGVWRPLVLDATEAALTADLAELIIPETNTPGAKKANVHQYIDWKLSEDTRARQDRFRSGLESFAGLEPPAQIALLKKGGVFFDELQVAHRRRLLPLRGRHDRRARFRRPNLRHRIRRLHS